MGVIKDGALQTVAGGCAGLVEVCIMHPLDLIKTRFQVQRGPDDPQRYKGLIDCFTKIYRNEGFLSFYKGIFPPILAETPKRAIKFASNEQFKKLFTNERWPLPLTFSLAGFCTGLTEAVAINPFEVVKVKQQAERSTTLLQQKSAYATAREIMKRDGLGTKGLYQGITATLGRHSIWNMFYFGLYHSLMIPYPPPKDNIGKFWHKFSFGFLAGTLASVANIPFDVAKSRIQGPQPVPGVRKYDGCYKTLCLVYKEEGFFALYKGFLPKVLRLGPGGGIMMIVYETVYEFLKVRF